MSEQPHHVSVYDLQVEQHTAFGRWYTPGVHPLPSEAAAVDMLRAASAELRGAGYERECLQSGWVTFVYADASPNSTAAV